MPRADKAQALLRGLPGVDALVGRAAAHPDLRSMPRQRVTESAREVLAAERRRVLEGASSVAEASTLAERVVDRLTRSGVFSLDRVINATGVVLHTNLGRAPLSGAARDAVATAAGMGTLALSRVGEVAVEATGGIPHPGPLLTLTTTSTSR